MYYNKVFKRTGAEYYAKDNKSAAVVHQIITGSATLQWGRASPLRWTRRPVQNQFRSGIPVYFIQVLFGGKPQLRRMSFSSLTSAVTESFTEGT